MSSSDQRTPFVAGFMDDYYAEAEEHIVAVRRVLLRLEAALGADLPADALEELFRSFHSLKGISAMVELREPELLAHHMESCLRALRNGHVLLTASTFDTLLDGAKMLEDVILAHRNSTPRPAVTPILDRLNAFAHAAPEASEGDIGPIDGATKGVTAARVWRVTFTPSPALVARGVKVDTVRNRLLQIGQVLNIAPKVVTGGGVSFEFEVATNDEQRLADWQEDGISFEPMRTIAAALAPTSASELVAGVSDLVSVAGPPRDVTRASAASFVRVDLARLDDLMRLVGDMVVTRARLEDTLQRVEPHVPPQNWRVLQEHTSRMERQLRDLREGVMRVRLVPVGEIFRRMPFVVRDLARDGGKRVKLDLVGQGTEIDKFLIERMMDPVLHVVRNAISHAIEAPDQRIAAGKPPDGTIRLSAATAGESVILEISDDGRGIDVPAVVSRARQRGMPVPDGPMDRRALLDIICASGFSTRDEADRASGRGVGLAVVRSTVEGLGGTLAVETQEGRGTAFTITLPLTLAITDAIIAHVGTHTFAVPQSAVREVIEVDPAALRSMERNELLTYRGGTLPMVRLAHLFSIKVEERPRLHAIVVGAGRTAVGLVVDRIVGQQEIVVKTITDPLIHVDGVSGATELGDGRLVLILDAAALSRTLRARIPAEGLSA
jgi:two-component system, chemotaxis family, sensor kinase CheA